MHIIKIENADLTIDNDFENIKRNYVNDGYTKIETFQLKKNLLGLVQASYCLVLVVKAVDPRYYNKH